MEKVEGIGGFFFRTADPGALSAWYEKHLGIDPVGEGPDDPSWLQKAGPTVFCPFPKDTEYFGAPSQAWMINFRVRDLDAILEQLRAESIAVSHHHEMEGIGRFARIHDPEGNPIELWEPV